jgi:hypothetical protein
MLQKIVSNMARDEDKSPYTRYRSSRVAPVTAIIILQPGVKLSEFDAFRFSLPASDEDNPIDDDTRMVQKLIFGRMGVRQPPDSSRG